MWQDRPVWMTAICIASMRYACPREGVSLGRACAFAFAGEVCVCVCTPCYRRKARPNRIYGCLTPLCSEIAARSTARHAVLSSVVNMMLLPVPGGCTWCSDRAYLVVFAQSLQLWRLVIQYHAWQDMDGLELVGAQVWVTLRASHQPGSTQQPRTRGTRAWGAEDDLLMPEGTRP